MPIAVSSIPFTESYAVTSVHLREYFDAYPNYESRIKYLARLLGIPLRKNDAKEPSGLKTTTTTTTTTTNGAEEAEHERHLIVLDYFYYGLNFAKERQFSSEQLVAFFKLLRDTHEYCMGHPFVRLQHDYQHFKESILCKCVYRPPRSEKIFNYREVKAIHDYMLDTYFRHYTMYKYVLTKRPILTLTLTPNHYDVMEQTLPNPLSQLLSQTGPMGMPPTAHKQGHSTTPFVGEETSVIVNEPDFEMSPEEEEAKERAREEALLASIDPAVLEKVQRVVLEVLQPKLGSLKQSSPMAEGEKSPMK